MFDLYRLDSGFPGFEDCATHTEALQRVKCIETAFADDIDQEFGKEGISRRFIPYIQLHEFESLVFADPEALLTVRPNQEDAIKQLLEIKQAAGGAELVNGGHETTPSKRLLNLIPDYAKTVDGILTIKHIGFPKLKSQCPHFACWTERLLAAAATQKPQ